jgi:arylsulfatase A-like enzyme
MDFKTLRLYGLYDFSTIKHKLHERDKMNYALKIIHLPIIALVAWTCKSNSAEEVKVEKPNIILILADDLGYKDVGFNGSKEVPTPNLDKMAQAGVRFTNAYVSHPYSGPSRAGLITGRYQRRFGVQANPHGKGEGLPKTEKTLGTLLKKSGYHTGVIGKWHLGFTEGYHPNERGFDEFFGFLGGGHQYFTKNYKEKSNTGYDGALERNGEAAQEYIGKDMYVTDILSDEACSFISRNKDKPFFLYMNYNAPHAPFQASQKYLDRVKDIELDTSFITEKEKLKEYMRNRRIYIAMINAMDEGIGQIQKTLKEEGLTENTMIVFLSDNGGDGRFNHRFVGDEYAVPSPGNHPLMLANNLPLRGNKSDLLEGGIRVPFLISWPGSLPEDVDYTGVVSSLDIVPTALEIAGGNLPTNRTYDGNNIIPYLGKKEIMERSFYWYRFKPLAYGNKIYGDRLEIAFRRGDWKLYRHGKDFSFKLFNLANDIGELNDLASQYPEKVKELIIEYEKRIQIHKAPLYFDYPDSLHHIDELYYTHGKN